MTILKRGKKCVQPMPKYALADVTSPFVADPGAERTRRDTYISNKKTRSIFKE